MNAKSEQDSATLKRLFAESKWFHSIDFGSAGVSPGRFAKNFPANFTLYGVLRFLESIRLQGMTCLDVGTMDGLAAFAMKQAGAERVIATDMAERESFVAGRAALGLDIEYVVPARLDNFAATAGRGVFDLIVCAGVLYHVFEPLTALVLCREMLKQGGLLVLETQCLSGEPNARIQFSPADPKRGSKNANIFFRPSYSALVGMLEVAGFEVVSSITVGAGPESTSRIAVLARAAKPGEIRSASPMVRKILKQYANYKNYGERIDYRALNAQAERSTIQYSGQAGIHYFIHASRFRTRFSLQPVFSAGWMRRALLTVGECYAQLRASRAHRRWLSGFNRPTAN